MSHLRHARVTQARSGRALAEGTTRTADPKQSLTSVWHRLAYLLLWLWVALPFAWRYARPVVAAGVDSHVVWGPLGLFLTLVVRALNCTVPHCAVLNS
eukprot:970581-Prorocentrum_minimum.AAC.2